MKSDQHSTTGLVAGGLLGTLTVANKLTESMAGELKTILTGEERRYPWKYGNMFYEVKGERGAKPLLLTTASHPALHRMNGVETSTRWPHSSASMSSTCWASASPITRLSTIPPKRLAI